MKIIYLMVVALLCAYQSYSQDQYIAYRTEIFTWNIYKEQWDLEEVNEETNIMVTVSGNRIKVNAKSPSSFVLQVTGRDINGSGWKGRRWSAYEQLDKQYCTVDLYKYEDGDLVLSVYYGDRNKGTKGFNIRYYLVQ